MLGNQHYLIVCQCKAQSANFPFAIEPNIGVVKYLTLELKIRRTR
jgi:ribosome-binding ATPase YchF (GTP1/OBG family)